MPNMAVSIDFDLDPTITEYALGHDSHHINTVNLLAGDKRGRFVIWIGRACADRSDKGAVAFDDVSIPSVLIALIPQKRNKFLIARLNDRERIKPDQIAAMIGITIACACFAIRDVTHHRTGIASDLFRCL